MGDGLLDEVEGAVDVDERLLKVDDVNRIALGEDIALHLGVPPAGLVPEVDAGFKQLAHANDCHGRPFSVRKSAFRFLLAAGSRFALALAVLREPRVAPPRKRCARAREFCPADAGHPTSVVDRGLVCFATARDRPARAVFRQCAGETLAGPQAGTRRPVHRRGRRSGLSKHSWPGCRPVHRRGRRRSRSQPLSTPLPFPF